MIGVVAHQRGHVEGGREPGLTMLEEVPKRSFVSAAVPKPANWRIVLELPRYIEG